MSHRLDWVLSDQKQHPNLCTHSFFFFWWGRTLLTFCYSGTQTTILHILLFYHWSYSQDCQPFGSNFSFHCRVPQGELSLYSESPNAKIYFFKLKLDPVVKLFRLHSEPPWMKSVEQEHMEYLWQYITYRSPQEIQTSYELVRRKSQLCFKTSLYESSI